MILVHFIFLALFLPLYASVETHIQSNVTTTITTTTTPSAPTSAIPTPTSKNITHPTSTSTHAPQPTPTIPTSYNGTVVNGTASNDVLFQLTCQVQDDAYCKKVYDNIRLALLEFANVVSIQQAITIQINYYSFCQDTCANASLGWGTPSSEYILHQDGVDLNHAYPQALAKQLVVPTYNTEVWLDTDVNIALNHDYYLSTVDYDIAAVNGWNGTGVPPGGSYWYFNDSSYGNYTMNIESYQVDFRYLVLHQLIHGLGFLSSWAGYFSSQTSPFHELVAGMMPDDQLQWITPGMHWKVPSDGGPIYITGFQQTLLFDKFLLGVNQSSAAPTNMSEIGFSMLNFCVNDNQEFILYFLQSFNSSSQATVAHQLYNMLSNPGGLVFNLPNPTINNSIYLTNSYLNASYKNMTLSTGLDLLNAPLEQFDDTSSRPTAAISHLDIAYNGTVDFLMVQQLVQGSSLEQLVQTYYQSLPVNITYNVTTGPNYATTTNYMSPIGPGILRMLDAMGYSTILTPTKYVTNSNASTPRFRSNCGDSNANNNPSPKSPSLSPSSSAGTSLYHLLQSPLLTALFVCLGVTSLS
ncbi:hypothetical protein DM01DRAFT_1337832 [Hesseltinella vesiculosa]|uniref:Uncharacterized protein n=1 Tax=Hesseltinella vesiculosa TaxID=101127 RepID=A0A1X2GBR8_9FUNG|nr:hypothetical protein DM01DRAFT_1337832 [Hesseltinella vesiculosa]